MEGSTHDPAERHKALVADGWTRRFSVEEPRLSEVRRLYESLGLEVRIETGIPDQDQECRGCFTAQGFADRYKTIYTRGREKAAKDLLDDLS
ncbi:MAG: hypothetical protein AB1646_23710 [Thermodesulfobacteriota bacterium]